MVAQENLREWLRGLIFVGREGEDDDPFQRDDQGEILVEDDEQVLKDGWEFDEGGKPVKVDNSDDSDDGDDVAELKESLRKERQLRRKAEREARKSAKKKTQTKEDKDLEATRSELEATRVKTEKLARGLANTKVDAAILEEARNAGFIDPTDALLDSVRREVDFDQDDEDPSDIEIDMDSVKDAVKDLADRKKHLISSGDGTQSENNNSSTSSTRTGNRVKRKQGAGPEGKTEEELRKLYPNLNLG